jgi:hypothetical protein
MIAQNKDVNKKKSETINKNIIDTDHVNYNETPEIIQTILLPLELWSLETIFSFKRPMSAGEFFSLKVFETFIEHLETNNPFNDNKTDTIILSKQEILNVLPNIILDHKVGYMNPDDVNYRKEDLNELKDMYNISYNDLKTIENLLRKKNIEIPSYKLIVSNLDNLVSWNFLVKRDVEKKHEKSLYIINPRLYIKYGQVLDYFLRYGYEWKIIKAKHERQVLESKETRPQGRRY